MGTAEIIAIVISVSAVLVAVSLATVTIIWQMNVQGSRSDNRIDKLGDRLSDEIRSQGAELTETRLEQARIEGANRILRRQSHTHPPHNPPIDQEAAAD